MPKKLPSSGAGASLLWAEGEPGPHTVPTLCRLSCFSTMWSLFSKACFSLQRLGLGKNWGREQESVAAGKEACSPHPFSQDPGVPGLCLLTLRKGTMSNIWRDQWSQVFIKSWTQS